MRHFIVTCTLMDLFIIVLNFKRNVENIYAACACYYTLLEFATWAFDPTENVVVIFMNFIILSTTIGVLCSKFDRQNFMRHSNTMTFFVFFRKL